MGLREIREFINLRIYDSKASVLRAFRVMSVIVAIFSVGCLLYYHGFNTTLTEQNFIIKVIKWSFGFYILKYGIRLFYSFQPLKDIRDSVPEAVLMLIIILNFLSSSIFGWEMIHSLGNVLGFDHLENFFILVIQAYLFIILINEVGRAVNVITHFNLSPPALLVSSFLLLIALGCGLLSMPAMSATGKSIPFLEALFTSISASCVTGLVIVDTATHFSFKGQFVIMALIQLGGLNIISFATIFALFARRGLGLKHQSIIQENLNTESLSDSNTLFKQIFIFSLSLEVAGAILIFLNWSPQTPFNGFWDKAFFSLFHSISAFNNAGFSLFSQGLFENNIANSYSLHLVIAVLIICGGIGFATLRDVFSIKEYRERKKKPWKSFKVNTKISLISAGVLIAAGFIVFYVFESGNTMSERSLGGKVVSSLFQSISTRTAGFNTIDIGQVTTPALIFTIFLMFIGASPGSTGGGIKTNTFAMVLLGAWSTSRGKERLELFRSTIPFDLLNKALLIFLFAIAFISIGIFGLAIVEPDTDLIALSFEEVSAFCTVGLSTGITSDLSLGGKIIIMISMFVGRIGPLTVAFALGGKKQSTDYKYPKASVQVG